MLEGITKLARRLTAGAFLLLAACEGEHPQTMVEPVTEYGRIQIDLWATVTWWTVGIMVVVFGALAIILVRYRARPGGPEPKPIYGNTKLEIAWTVIPALIILFISIPTVQAIFETQAEAPEDALIVEAIGHQWWWEFRYPEQGIITANELYLPTGRPIAFQLRSADVIHSFWIPRLGGKKDVNPVVRTPEGVEPLHLNQIVLAIDSTGEYLGQCAEYCGTSHAIMRMNAVAVAPAEFEAWVEAFRAPEEPAGEMAQRGKEIFMSSSCIACHAIQGTTAQGRLGPDLTFMGERFSIGAGLLRNTPENLTRWILEAPELKKGIIMPGADVAAGGMAPTGLSRADAAAIAAYLTDLRRPLFRGLPDAPAPGLTPPSEVVDTLLPGATPEDGEIPAGDPTLVAPAEPVTETTVPPEGGR